MNLYEAYEDSDLDTCLDIFGQEINLELIIFVWIDHFCLRWVVLKEDGFIFKNYFCKCFIFIFKIR